MTRRLCVCLSVFHMCVRVSVSACVERACIRAEFFGWFLGIVWADIAYITHSNVVGSHAALNEDGVGCYVCVCVCANTHSNRPTHTRHDTYL